MFSSKRLAELKERFFQNTSRRAVNLLQGLKVESWLDHEHQQRQTDDNSHRKEHRETEENHSPQWDWGLVGHMNTPLFHSPVGTPVRGRR